MTFTGRAASIDFQMLLSNLLDLLSDIVTNGQATDVAGAVALAVDCPDLSTAVNDLACSVTNGSTCTLSWFPAVCNVIATALGSGIETALQKTPIQWQLLDFTQTATANDTPPADGRADTLTDGTVSGNTNFFVGRPMTGTWSGKR